MAAAAFVWSGSPPADAARSTLTYARTIGLDGAAEMYPSGLDLDPTGIVYAADTGNDKVKAYDPSGSLLWSVGTRGTKALGSFFNPRDVAYLGGKVYVADTGNNRVQVLGAATGTPLSQWTGFMSIMGVGAGTSAAGDPIVFVVQDTRHRVDVYTPAGAFLFSVGSGPGNGNGQLRSPRDAATDSSGNIYVADYYNNRIAKFAPNGVWLKNWGKTGSAHGQFLRPYGVAVDASDNVYVADSNNARIEKFDSDGTYLATWGSVGPGAGIQSLAGQFNHLRRVAVGAGATPDVYAAGLWHDYKIERFAQEGSHLQTFGGAGPLDGSLNTPGGIALDPTTSQVYVADQVNQRFQRFSAGGDFELAWAHRGWGSDLLGVAWPRGITFNEARGTVVVADTKNNQLKEFTRDGVPTGVVAGVPGAAVGQLSWPFAIASYGPDVIVANTKNNRVERWDLATRSVVWAASGFTTPRGVTVVGDTVYVAAATSKQILLLDAADGSVRDAFMATSASFPAGIAVEPNGDIWIGDVIGDRLIEYAPDGEPLQIFGGLGSDHGRFNDPTNLQFLDGRLYVADELNNRIEVFALGDVPGTSLASYSASYGYSGPAGTYAYGMDYDATDNTVLVGDYWNNRVKRYTADGVFLRIVSKTAPLGLPGGICVPYDVEADPAGNVIVADQNCARVVVFDHLGNWVRTIGYGGSPSYPPGCGGGSMTIPTHVLYDQATGNYYVSDPRCGAVYVFDSTGTFLFEFDWTAYKTEAGLTLVTPRGIDADADGNIYVAEHRGRTVAVFDRLGNYLRKFAHHVDMNDPRGIAIDRVNGLIYLVAAFHNEVFVFSLDGTLVDRWRDAGGTPFDSIRFPAADDNGNVWISDTWAYRVWKLTKDGVMLPWATPAEPPPDGGLRMNLSIATSPAGKLFAVDHYDQRTQRFDLGSSCWSKAFCDAFEMKWGSRSSPSGESEGFAYPRSVAFGEGSVWVGDHASISRWTPDGVLEARFGTLGPGVGQFRGVQALEVADSKIFVVDINNCRLQVLELTGTPLASMGSCGSGAGQMSGPRGVAVDGSLAYVGDTRNNRIVVWDTATSVAVDHLAPTCGSVRLLGPMGVTFDPAKQWLYVANSGNKRVLRMRPDGSSCEVVTTGADTGQGTLGGPRDVDFGPDGRLYVNDANRRIYAFVVDKTAPSATLAFPVAAGAYTAAEWEAGCPTAGLCGTHADEGLGVEAVELSLRRESDGLYWDGSAFASALELFHPATLAGAEWSFAFPAASFPAGGDYAARVRARDYAGNEGETSVTFAITS